eukprot:scaffold30784_cov34-Tisochrysis_lutea.AAC.2
MPSCDDDNENYERRISSSELERASTKLARVVVALCMTLWLQPYSGCRLEPALMAERCGKALQWNPNSAKDMLLVTVYRDASRRCRDVTLSHSAPLVNSHGWTPTRSNNTEAL